MRHPFDGVNDEQAVMSRRAALGAMAGLALPAAAAAQRPSTRALGEEGGKPVTTYAIGEEGGGGPTTLAIGEEGGATTKAIGEEGGAGVRPCTTEPFGEEAGRVLSIAQAGAETGTPLTRAVGEAGAGNKVLVPACKANLSAAVINAAWGQLSSLKSLPATQAAATLYGANGVERFLARRLSPRLFTGTDAAAMRRAERALEILVALKSPAAKQVLQNLSRGDQNYWLVREARKALARCG